MAKIVKIWDGKTAINGVPAAKIIEDREDIKRGLGDIFLVEDGYGHVTEIQFGSVMKANLGLNPSLTLIEVAQAYLAHQEAEANKAQEESVTVAEMQEQLAMLMYEVAMNKDGGVN